MVLTYLQMIILFCQMHAFDRQMNRKATAIARSNKVRCALKTSMV